LIEIVGSCVVVDLCKFRIVPLFNLKAPLSNLVAPWVRELNISSAFPLTLPMYPDLPLLNFPAAPIRSSTLLNTVPAP